MFKELFTYYFNFIMSLVIIFNEKIIFSGRQLDTRRPFFIKFRKHRSCRSTSSGPPGWRSHRWRSWSSHGGPGPPASASTVSSHHAIFCKFKSKLIQSGQSKITNGVLVTLKLIKFSTFFLFNIAL